MRRQGFGIAPLIVVVCLLVPGISGAAGTIHSLSSQLPYWSNNGINGDLNECVTTSNPSAAAGGGKICYEKSVVVPADSNTLLVDVGAIAESDGDEIERVFEAVTVDGTACVSGSSGAFTPVETGWVQIQQFQDKDHPIASSYPWCCKVTPGSHTVDLKIASDLGNDVEMDQINVTINSGFYPAGARCDFVANF